LILFACLYSLSTPLAALVSLAESFTPRFDVRGPLVMLDVSGLSRLLGSFQEIGEQLRRSSPGPVRIAIAPTQTAAALLALGRAGLTVVASGEQAAALAPLQVSVLGELDRLRVGPEPDRATRHPRDAQASPPVTASVAPRAVKSQPPQVGDMWDALPYFKSSLDRTSELVVKTHCGGGWTHPRQAHAAHQTRPPRRPVTAMRDTEHPPPLAQNVRASFGETGLPPLAQNVRASVGGVAPKLSAEADETSAVPVRAGTAAVVVRPASRKSAESMAQALDLLQTLRRWGIKTLGALAVLPSGEVYERLGARGVAWQRLARGEDTSPMVPWVPEEPFDASLELEWPIEGLEPLSFVLGRLLEPLSARLERADRGAAIVHTHLRLVSKIVHARTLQLPAPMRDPKTLRTLVLLDLETNPPGAAVDEVRLLIEPTPARVVQWTLYERAQPSPEQTSTLLARLTALMGESHVGSPQLVDTWKPGQFTMTPFEIRPAVPDTARSTALSTTALSTARSTRPEAPHVALGSPHAALGAALRRFRLPVPVRVQVQEGRPIRISTDRRGVTGGPVVQAAGPWRTSGEWWNDAAPVRLNASWDRDEWDVAIDDGTVYRLYVAREVGQWFLDGIVD
jgi:protein ImuB